MEFYPDSSAAGGGSELMGDLKLGDRPVTDHSLITFAEFVAACQGSCRATTQKVKFRTLQNMRFSIGW